MKVAAKLDKANNAIVFNVSTDKFVPKYLYYLCEKILTIDNNIVDWQDWFVQLTDTRISIAQLKNMSEW